MLFNKEKVKLWLKDNRYKKSTLNKTIYYKKYTDRVIQRLCVNRKKGVLASVVIKDDGIYSHYQLKDVTIALNRVVADSKELLKAIHSKGEKNETTKN